LHTHFVKLAGAGDQEEAELHCHGNNGTQCQIPLVNYVCHGQSEIRIAMVKMAHSDSIGHVYT